MRWKYYFGIRKIFSSPKNGESSFLLSIYIFLTSCIFSFLSLIVHLSNYELALLINLFVLYLIILYNQPLITREFNNNRFFTYCTDIFVRLKLLFFLVIDNNPFHRFIFVYLVINVFLNFSDLYKIFILIYSLSIICNLLIIKQIISDGSRFAYFFVLIFIVLISFYKIEITPLLFLFNLSILYFIVIKYIKIPITSNRHLNRQLFNSSVYYGGDFFIFKAVVKQIYINSYKIIFWILINIVAGVVASKFFTNDFTSVFLYNAMLEFELQVDEKYKYLYKFLPKFYFLKNGGLNFFERFIISYNFLYSMKTSLYMIAFGLGTNTNLYKLILYLVFLVLLSIAYFKMEEKMYIKMKKINNLIFQYIIFTLLSIMILLINLL